MPCSTAHYETLPATPHPGLPCLAIPCSYFTLPALTNQPNRDLPDRRYPAKTRLPRRDLLCRDKHDPHRLACLTEPDPTEPNRTLEDHTAP